MSNLATAESRRAEYLVSTLWVAENLDNPNIRFVESNEDPLLYSAGHIPGAAEIDWTRDLNDPLIRDYLDREHFDALCRRNGISQETLIVFYGDKNNWWATYAMWVFQLFGHTNCKIMDGGRLKWQRDGLPLVREKPTFEPSAYESGDRDDDTHRAYRDQVLEHVKHHGKMIDVRSPEEFNGTRLHMEAYPNEGALRGGHIPGAKSIPWARAVNPEDGTFKSTEELMTLYGGEADVNPEDDIIVYCRIGERSSHTWFVLHYLLGYPKVRNYDGSWTEWGNSVGVPIEK